MVSKPPLTGQVPGGAVQDAATPARLSPPPRPRRRRRRLEPGCGAVRQARESGADGSNMAAPSLSREKRPGKLSFLQSIVGIAAAEQGFWKALCT